MLIDTHCHLDFKDFDGDRDETIDRAKKAGVARIINVGSSLDGSLRSIELARKYDPLYASVGIHPHDAKSVTDKIMENLKNLAADDKVVAIGEVGLDYYRNLSPKSEQAEAFRKFIRLAKDTELPVILHSRQAEADMLDILKEEAGSGINGVIHCFSGDKDFLKSCLGLGLHVSFTCNLTFKNAKTLREVAKLVPPERLLLETDSPFLSPEGQRGKRNEPMNVSALADEWAGILELSKEDIERITTHNANRLFGLGIEEPSEIAYPIRDSVYLNITNRCSNECDFCIRDLTDFVKGHNLKLDREPTAGEILKAIGDPSKYKEAVFCGYGEPTMRLDVIKSVAKELKKNSVKIRLVTNGHGSLINSKPIAEELSGLVDRISVSLNADTLDGYYKLCRPKFGRETYRYILDFIKDCVRNNIDTEITCLDLPGIDINKCERIAEETGAHFRLRIHGVVG